MADILPINFPVPSESAIASYDWVDFASKTGYHTYYAAISNLTGGDVYFLTPQTLDSSPISVSTATSNAGWSNTDFDFDIEFNSPVTISGEALINLTITAGDTNSTYAVVTFYRVDTASAEHSMGTATTETLTAAGAESFYRFCVKAALSETNFAIGEKLRVNIIHYGYKTNAGTSAVVLYIDPNSRKTFTETSTSATIGTDLKIQVPFKIQI